MPAAESSEVKLEKGPNIVSLPEFEALPDELDLEVLLKVGDDISTDEIMPAGAKVLPYRSNVPEISKFCFEIIDATYYERAQQARESGGHAVIAGDNYGQGSSREHAALAPRFLGLRLVLAKSFARIHWQNLVNFGVVPLRFDDPAAYDQLESGDRLQVSELRTQIKSSPLVRIECRNKGLSFHGRHDLSARQVEVLLAGGLINWVRQRTVQTV
jgi:aconitate hydratase